MFITGVYANLTRRFLQPESPRWRTDTGSSYNFPQRTTSRCSRRLRQRFLARLIHFHRYHDCPISDNSIRCKSEVETVPQTGSTNSLTTETNIDAISVAIPMFWGKVFHSCICQPQMTLPSSRIFNMAGGRIPEVVITLRQKTTSRCSQRLSNVLGHVRSTSTGFDNIRFRRTVPGTNRK